MNLENITKEIDQIQKNKLLTNIILTVSICVYLFTHYKFFLIAPIIVTTIKEISFSFFNFVFFIAYKLNNIKTLLKNQKEDYLPTFKIKMSYFFKSNWPLINGVIFSSILTVLFYVSGVFWLSFFLMFNFLFNQIFFRTAIKKFIDTI